MTIIKTDYAALLRASYRQHLDDRANAAPISLTEYRARLAIDAWRQRMLLSAIPEQQSTRPISSIHRLAALRRMLGGKPRQS